MRSNASVWSSRILDASVAMEDTCGEHTYCIPCAYGAPAKSDTVHDRCPDLLSFFLSRFRWTTLVHLQKCVPIIGSPLTEARAASA